MNELEIINHLKKIVNNSYSHNLNDDVFFDKKKLLVISIDTYNENIHYIDFKNPKLVIKKAIRSSISDIISKGANPKFLLISFSGTKDDFSKKKIKTIIKSIDEEQKKYKFSLVGGDTVSSKKTSFTICAIGYSKKIIRRSECNLNDDIYLTGNIGDSFVGLCFLKKKIKSSSKIKKYFINSYFKPNLSFGFHNELNKFASSSMDVSDGLLLDLKKLIGNKKLGYILDFNVLPRSNYFNQLEKKNKISAKKFLFNGDDYQILFTSKKKHRKIINKYAKKWNQKITRIGYITSRSANYLKFSNYLKKIDNYQGYIHSFN